MVAPLIYSITPALLFVQLPPQFPSVSLPPAATLPPNASDDDEDDTDVCVEYAFQAVACFCVLFNNPQYQNQVIQALSSPQSVPSLRMYNNCPPLYLQFTYIIYKYISESSEELETSMLDCFSSLILGNTAAFVSFFDLAAKTLLSIQRITIPGSQDSIRITDSNNSTAAKYKEIIQKCLATLFSQSQQPQQRMAFFNDLNDKQKSLLTSFYNLQSLSS